MLDCQQGLRGILLGAWEQESRGYLKISSSSWKTEKKVGKVL